MVQPSMRAGPASMALCTLLLLLAMHGTSAHGPASVAAFVQQRPGLATFSSLLAACPSLSRTLEERPRTVFAPSDEAFAALLTTLKLSQQDLSAHTGLLCSVLQYHVLPQPLLSSALSPDPTSLETLLAGTKVTVEMRSGTVFVSGARVLTPDLQAGPSVIHVVDRVLLPPSLEHLTSSFEGLVDALSAVNAHPRLGSLVGALTQAADLQQPGKQQPQQPQQQQKQHEQQKHGHHEHHEQRQGARRQQPSNTASALQPASSRRLQSLLGLGDLPELSTLIAGVLQLVQTPGLTAALRAPVTLFVPSNAAIGGAIEWLLQSNRDLLSSPDLLASTLARILSYHAVSGIQRVTTATSPVRVRTLEGSIATLSSANGTKRINGYRVLHTYSLPHYVIYTVDRLLIPPSIQLPTPQPPSQMVRDLANALPELSDSIAAVLGTEDALLEALVLLQTPLTVFFPSNQAVIGTFLTWGLPSVQLLLNPDRLLQLLAYHFVPRPLPSRSVPAAPTNLTTLEGSQLLVQRTASGVVLVNNARVLRADLRGGPSYVHTIDRFLQPPHFPYSVPAPAPGTFGGLSLSSVISVLPELGVLIAGALNLPFVGGVAGAVDPSRRLTVMVPTNAALAAGWIGIITQAPEVITRPELLHRLLAYYVSPTDLNVWALPLNTVVRAPTLAGYNVTVNITSAARYVNGVRVLYPSSGASTTGYNYRVLILNRILLPPGFPRVEPVPVALVNDLVNSLPEASDVIAAALGATQLREIISKADDRFTFFAPSNQAIRNLLDLLSSLGINITLEEVLGGLLKLADNTGSLNGATDSPAVRLILQILSYHVVPSRVIRSTDITSSTSVPTLLPTKNLVLEMKSGVLTINSLVHVVRANIPAGNAIVHLVDSLLLPPPLNLILANPSLLATFGSLGLGGAGDIGGVLGAISALLGGRR